MSERVIYHVGKPYPFWDAKEAISRLGYKMGLILDRDIIVNNLHLYDKVLVADFTAPHKIAAQYRAELQDAAGLLCTIENYIIARAIIAKDLGLPGQSIESAEMCTDKLMMRDAFDRYRPGISPQFVQVGPDDNVLAKTSHLRFPLIIKPANLVKSLFVMRCNTAWELDANYSTLKGAIHELYSKQRIYNRPPRIIVEEYMPGQLCSVAAFVDAKGTPHFCKGIASIRNASERGFDDNFLYSRILPTTLDDKLERSIFDVAQAGIRALDMRSIPAHVELIHDGHSAHIIEIGARIGGYRPRMYALSYGLDLIEQEMRLALGKTPITEGDFKAYCGVYELFPKQVGHLKEIAGLGDPNRFTHVSRSIKNGTKIGAIVGPAKQGYKAAVSIIITSPDAQKFQRLQHVIDAMEVVTEP